jgi:lysophospholipase L1-like esterase
MVAQIDTAGGILDRINAHPAADVVWLSAGGNDLLLGQLGGGFYVNNPNNASVYAAVQANVQTIVNAILADRPNLQVVIMGYDYLNIWDQGSGSAADTFRANLEVIKTGNVVYDGLVQNQAVNDGFKAAEAGKIAIANASSRVAEVYNFGLNNTYGGYSGYFGNFAAGSTYPPELYPYLPTPPNRMDPGDAIHLNNLGYTTLALHAEQDFLLSEFSSTSLGLSSGALAFGQVRIGTSSSLNVTGSNTGPNFTKV